MPAKLMSWPNASNGAYAPATVSIRPPFPRPLYATDDIVQKTHELKLAPGDGDRLPTRITADACTWSSRGVHQVSQSNSKSANPKGRDPMSSALHVRSERR